MKKVDKKKELDSKAIKKLGKIGKDEFVKPKKSVTAKIGEVISWVVLGAVVGVLIKIGVTTTIPFIDNEDIMPEVAKELCVNIDTIKNDTFNGEIVRLKPNLSNNVYVYIDDKIEDRTQDNIRNSLEYFNNIMSDINDNYHFVECNKATYLSNLVLYNSTVSFDYEDLGAGKRGYADLGVNKALILQRFENIYNKNIYNMRNQIFLDKEKFAKMSDYTQISIIRHELLHVFGILDTYYGYAEEASLINVEYTGVINEIGPSDLRKLYLMYDKKLKSGKNTINQTELARVKEHISIYEEQYYAKIMDKIVEDNYLNLFDISDEEIANFSSVLSENGMRINIDENGNFTYESKDGTYVGTREIVKGKNYVILPDISTKYKEDFYIIIKDKNGLHLKNAFTVIPRDEKYEEQLDDTNLFIR